MNYQEIDEKVSVLRAVLIKSLVVVGVGLLAGAGYFAYQHHLETKNQEAADLFYRAVAMEASPDADAKTPQGAAAPSFDAQKIAAWDPAKLEKYTKILTEIDDKYSGTPTWALAQIRRAKIQIVQNNAAGAEKLYAGVLSSMKRTPLYYGLAADALGVLHENLGQNEQALTVYKNAAAELRNPLRPLAMLGEARVLATLGQKGSVEIYEKIVKEFPETAYSRRAKVLRSTTGVQTGAM